MLSLLNSASIVTTAEMIGTFTGLADKWLKYYTPDGSDDTAYPHSTFFGMSALAGLSIAYATGISLWPGEAAAWQVPVVAGIATGWYHIFWWTSYQILSKVGDSPYVAQYLINLFDSINAGIFTAATVYLIKLLAHL